MRVNSKSGSPAMPRPSKLILLPVALSIAACLAVEPVMGQGGFPEVWPPEVWSPAPWPFPNDPKVNMPESKSERLPPLDPRLAPGNKFDKEIAGGLLAKTKSPNSWHKVPAWLRGKWQSTQTIITLLRDERTGKEEPPNRVETSNNEGWYGHYADKTGQVWGCDQPYYWTENDRPQYKAYDFIITRTATAVTDTSCRFRSQSVDFYVDKTTGTIIQVVWDTKEQTISPISASITRHKSNCRIIDWQGNPTLTEELVSDYKRTADFKPNPSETTPDGKPLYPLFVQYLKDHNMADRIPDASPAPEPVAKP